MKCFTNPLMFAFGSNRHVNTHALKTNAYIIYKHRTTYLDIIDV